MNRVRKVSRKYAEMHNRPDHIARVAAREVRKGATISQVVDHQMVEDHKPRVVEQFPTKAAAKGRFARMKNFFRRGNR